jgi:hypothetical protein
MLPFVDQLIRLMSAALTTSLLLAAKEIRLA